MDQTGPKYGFRQYVVPFFFWSRKLRGPPVLWIHVHLCASSRGLLPPCRCSTSSPVVTSSSDTSLYSVNVRNCISLPSSMMVQRCTQTLARRIQSSSPCRCPPRWSQPRSDRATSQSVGQISKFLTKLVSNFHWENPWFLFSWAYLLIYI